MRRLLLALLCLCPPPLLAQGLDCADATSTAEIGACAAGDLEAADAALNAAYAEALKVAQRYKGEQEARLREAQRLWIGFRDAACEAEALLFEDGTMQPAAGTACLARLSSARAGDLRVYAGVGGL